VAVKLIAVDDGSRGARFRSVSGALVGALYLTEPCIEDAPADSLASSRRANALAGCLTATGRSLAGPGEHEIDRDQAAVVLRIFRDYAEGSNLSRDRGPPSTMRELSRFRGRAWNALDHSRICEASLWNDLQRDLSRRHHLEPRRQNTQSADGPKKCRV